MPFMAVSGAKMLCFYSNSLEQIQNRDEDRFLSKRKETPSIPMIKVKKDNADRLHFYCVYRITGELVTVYDMSLPSIEST